jgi:hypothetical protein
MTTATETNTATEHEAAGDLAPDPKAMPRSEAPRAALTEKNIEATLLSLLTTGEGPGAKATEKEPGSELPPGETTEAPEPGEEVSGEEQAQEQEQEREEAERTEWPESAQRRVDKLTAQKAELRETATNLQSEKDALTERVTELEQELQNRPTDGAAPVLPNDPLGFVKSPKELQEYASTVKTQIRQIEDYLDEAMDETRLPKFTEWAQRQGLADGNGNIDTVKLKQMKRLAQDALTDLVPQRAQHLQAEAEASQLAEQRFPWLKDTKSAQYKAFHSMVQSLPEIRRLPNWKVLGAIFVRGLEVAAAETAKRGANGGKPGATRPAAQPTRLPGRTTVLPQREAGADTTRNTLRKQAFQSRDPKAMEKYLAAELAGGVSQG